jgi:hypothetical protein
MAVAQMALYFAEDKESRAVGGPLYLVGWLLARMIRPDLRMRWKHIASPHQVGRSPPRKFAFL